MSAYVMLRARARAVARRDEDGWGYAMNRLEFGLAKDRVLLHSSANRGFADASSDAFTSAGLDDASRSGCGRAGTSGLLPPWPHRIRRTP